MNEKAPPTTIVPPPKIIPPGPVYDRKIVVVGDEGCGKTCLLTRYCDGIFSTIYIPSVYECSRKLVKHKPSGKTVRINFWDTVGDGCYERLRPLSYPDTDIFLICFSIGDPESLQNVQDKWYPELFHFSPGRPIILVGLKSDLRRKSEKPYVEHRDQVSNLVTAEQARIVAQRLKCSSYIECSAKENANVDRLFEVVIDVAVKNPRPRRRRGGCVVL